MAKKKKKAHSKSKTSHKAHHKKDVIKKAHSKGKHHKATKHLKGKAKVNKGEVKTPKVAPGVTIDSYQFLAKGLPVKISIKKVPSEFVPVYNLSTPAISQTTNLVLEKIRHELINAVELGIVDISDVKKSVDAEKKFEETISPLVRKYFPDVDKRTEAFLTAALIQRSLGLGDIESLMHDDNLEEIAINNANEPVWAYHRKHGWCKTTINLKNEDQVRHYASMIGRKVGRQLNMLKPLMDANLGSGDRVNATLSPISTHGNTITLRKFASKAWTITDMITTKTIDFEAAALIWEAMQYELSIIVAGGTATGKTSFLNALCAFIPPNQRVITIEDTRELRLPKFLQWVPMVTRQPNQEGKGAVTMLDLMVNSLRMRPDRILVGEIRRKAEAEVLFEAIHTGHSVYATVHANNTEETITRLTNPPIDIPKTMLPALSMIVVQYRNRRTGIRRTFEVSEILENATGHTLMQYDMRRDKLRKIGKSKSVVKTLHLYTGISKRELRRQLKEKENILKYLVKNNINTVDEVGGIFAEYYADSKKLMQKIRHPPKSAHKTSAKKSHHKTKHTKIHKKTHKKRK